MCDVSDQSRHVLYSMCYILHFSEYNTLSMCVQWQIQDFRKRVSSGLVATAAARGGHKAAPSGGVGGMPLLKNFDNLDALR